MNAEELKTEFGLEFPTEIDGYKRPGALENGHDWFLEIPQIIAKDKVLYTGMNLILSALLSNEKLLKQWHDTLQNVVNAQDWRIVTDTLKGYMTPELKKKLDGIATGANNYVHPSNHPATMITQDATHRFVTDTEKTTWNGKASTAVVSTTANGLMPKRDGSATSIFTGDGAWKQLAWDLITGKPSTFAPSAHNHDGSYLKLSGGSLTGALNLANGIWNKIGDDVYIGDSNQAGCLCIKGVNADSGIAFVNKDNTVQIAKLTYAGGNLISSAKIQANLAGTADKATNDSSNRNIVNTYATKASPAFSGTPTAPTPATSVNNTQLATTAFVQSLLSSRFTASKNDNGWWKDGNTGMIFQFFSYKPTTNYKDAIMPAINFPISFPNKCILVLPVLYNDDSTKYHDIAIQPVSTTNSSVIFFSQLHEPNPLQNITGTTIKALAIGY